MHHKFLVLGSFTIIPTTVVNSLTGEQHVEPRRLFHPEAAWLGSYNFTWNASRSVESAVIIRDDEIARRLRDEFCAILEVSEPLVWDSQHIKPEFFVEGPDEDEPPEND
jgi:phosphatidylserine/phosphatidylglycerophosphate/cardiolipin synthase-like enzyme